MKFNGDIIITDPMYICKKLTPEELMVARSNYPVDNDYFPYGRDVSKYPDTEFHICAEDEIPSGMKEIRQSLSRALKNPLSPYKVYRSKMYDECNEKYQNALDEWEDVYGGDWERTNCGENMDVLGLHTYKCRNTLYGDWSCITYNSDTKEVIGEFCADSGNVGVFLLEEVLSYNPDFNYHIERPWTTTFIPNFNGEIDFQIVETEDVYDTDTAYHSKGGKWVDREVRVIGIGSINFETRQTGF